MTTADELATHVADLDIVLAALDRVRVGAQRHRRFAFDQPWPVFIRTMRMLTPQAYGARIQNRLAEHFDWQVIPASLDRGDVRDARGQHHEVKVTLVTASNASANFVQIRPHQDVAGYHLFIVERDYTLIHLWLSHADMAQELATLGSSAHGTQAATAANRTKEWAIRLPWDRDSQLASRWIRDYGQPAPQLA